MVTLLAFLLVPVQSSRLPKIQFWRLRFYIALGRKCQADTRFHRTVVDFINILHSAFFHTKAFSAAFLCLHLKFGLKCWYHWHLSTVRQPHVRLDGRVCGERGQNISEIKGNIKQNNLKQRIILLFSWIILIVSDSMKL